SKSQTEKAHEER
ncbi:tetratricopeptide repeat family protein, partial [Vibrio parahaemolyticus V-223/04]